MLFSRVKISCFCAKVPHLVFHSVVVTYNETQFYIHLKNFNINIKFYLLIVADSRWKYQVFNRFPCKTFFKSFSPHWQFTISKGYDCWDLQAYGQWRRNWQTVMMSCYHRIHWWLLSWKQWKFVVFDDNDNVRKNK